MSRLKSATTGWCLLVAYVVAWDWVVAGKREGETLTSGFHRARKGRHRHTLAALWAVTTLHLFGLLPPRLDPFSWLARAVTG
jgi:hypothetical protein